MGPGNLKQLICKWYEHHPTFSGLGANAWCKQLKNNDPEDGPGHNVIKFSFAFTPKGAAAIEHEAVVIG